MSNSTYIEEEEHDYNVVTDEETKPLYDVGSRVLHKDDGVEYVAEITAVEKTSGGKWRYDLKNEMGEVFGYVAEKDLKPTDLDMPDPRVQNIEVPDGFVAHVYDGKVVVRPEAFRPREGQPYYEIEFDPLNCESRPFNVVKHYSDIDYDWEMWNVFETEREAKLWADRLNNAIEMPMERIMNRVKD